MNNRETAAVPAFRPCGRRSCASDSAVVNSDGRVSAYKPEELEPLFVERVNARDVEGLLALFEPEAVVAVAPDEVAHGRVAIRQVFEDLVASGVRLTLGNQQPTLRVGDLALTSTRPVDGGVTAEVARRQPDGTWRWVIDQWDHLGR